MSSLTGLGAVRRFFRSHRGERRRREETFGCLATNTIAELGLRSTSQRPLLGGYRRRLREAFASALGRAARAGEIDDRELDDRELDVQALPLATLALGLFVSLSGNPEAPDEAHELANAVGGLVRAWVPEPA
jgi:hypothetical protein